MKKEWPHNTAKGFDLYAGILIGALLMYSFLQLSPWFHHSTKVDEAYKPHEQVVEVGAGTKG